MDRLPSRWTLAFLIACHVILFCYYCIHLWRNKWWLGLSLISPSVNEVIKQGFTSLLPFYQLRYVVWHIHLVNFSRKWDDFNEHTVVNNSINDILIILSLCVCVFVVEKTTTPVAITTTPSATTIGKKNSENLACRILALWAFFCIRYDTMIYTCSRKLAGSQLSLPQKQTSSSTIADTTGVTYLSAPYSAMCPIHKTWYN